jgi:hypothetical protein
LSAASVTITRDDAGQSRFVGSVTCKNDRKAPIQLLRTSKLHVPPATGTLTVALDPPAKTSSRTSAGQGASSSGPSNAPVVSVWTGRDKPLLCLPEPLKTYAVMRDWSQDSCTFHPEKAEVQCKAAQPRLCKVDAFGVPLATPCACGAWRRATGFLSEQERKRLKETYNCDPSSTEVCTCEG